MLPFLGEDCPAALSLARLPRQCLDVQAESKLVSIAGGRHAVYAQYLHSISSQLALWQMTEGFYSSPTVRHHGILSCH